MNAKLTDDAVAGLPLSHGRAELLEEIMRTSVLDDRPIRTETPRRRTRWLVPVAAAVVVAALAGTAWWAGGSGPGGSGSGTQEVASQPIAGNTGNSLLLDAPGWTVTAVYADETGGEMTYENGEQSLDVMWGLADSYDGYVEDRRHIVEPPADGAPITVLGAGAQMWPYSATDHTAIREVENGQWIELRGSGMREAAYLALLDQLQLVDTATFEASLPDSFVTSDKRDAAIDAILDGIEARAGSVLPRGYTRGSVHSKQSDPYQLGAEVTGQVTCAWVTQYVDAKRAGDAAAAQEAVNVMTTSKQWPVLEEMNVRGDWPEWIWGIADDLAAGQVQEGWRQTCTYAAP